MVKLQFNHVINSQRLARIAYPLIIGGRKSRPGVTMLGSSDAPWPIPVDRLPGPGGVAYCGGSGNDITFEILLQAHYGLEVHTFDPTPRAIEYVKMVQSNGARILHHPWALSAADGSLNFYPPRRNGHVSHSLDNIQRTDSPIKVPARRITSVMEELGHSRIDLLKLDIEGAEHQVIRDCIENDVVPRVLLLEYDQPYSFFEVRKTHSLLKERGYRLVVRDMQNVLYCRS